MTAQGDAGARRKFDRGGPARPPSPIGGPGVLDEDEAPELTPEEVEELRKALEGRRATIVASIGDRQSEERDVSGGREVGDEMDEATLEGTTSMTSKLLERDVRLLAEIDRALAKLREGTYGLCEGTGEPIGHARLRLQPWARYSVSYQEELEREQRTRGGR